MPVIMHFSTFLKFLTLDTGDKIRHLEAYAKPGGFDYYRSSREAVLNYGAHGKSRDAITQEIEKIAPANGVEHNIGIFSKTADWMDKQAGNHIAPSRGVWPSPNKIFSVQIEPEIGLEQKTKTRILAVYPRKEPRLNRDKAGAGILLLQKAYNGKGDEEFGIIDAYGQRGFWSPTNISSNLLDVEIMTIENELKRIMD